MREIFACALERTLDLTRETLGNTKLLDELDRLCKQMARVISSKGKIIIFGNGGSMADAMHFAEELSGRYRNDRPALTAMALSDPAFISCAANDFGYDEVFARGVEAYCQPGDLVIGLSTSGNSENVFKALQKATEMQAFTCSFLGKDGGKILGISDFEIHIPSQDTARVQEMHMLLLHSTIEALENLLGY